MRLALKLICTLYCSGCSTQPPLAAREAGLGPSPLIRPTAVLYHIVEIKMIVVRQSWEIYEWDRGPLSQRTPTPGASVPRALHLPHTDDTPRVIKHDALVEQRRPAFLSSSQDVAALCFVVHEAPAAGRRALLGEARSRSSTSPRRTSSYEPSTRQFRRVPTTREA